MSTPSDKISHLRHLMTSRLRARHFSLLAAIADLGSIHRAAAAHGLSQPGVSKLLKEIEDAIGLPLFERTSSGTVPTIYGMRASRTFRAIMTEIDNLAHDLDAIRTGSGGVIRVGVINYISRSMISEAILDLWRSDHRFVVHLVNGNTESLVTALHALELDCVFARRLSAGNSANVTFMPVYHQEPGVLFNEETSNLGQEFDADQLAQMRWILPPKGTPGRTEFDRTLAAAGIVEPNTVAECSDLDLIYHLLRNETDVCAILPSDICAELVGKGGIASMPFNCDFEYPVVGIIELDRVARDPKVERFCQSMISVACRRQKSLTAAAHH